MDLHPIPVPRTLSRAIIITSIYVVIPIFGSQPPELRFYRYSDPQQCHLHVSTGIRDSSLYLHSILNGVRRYGFRRNFGL